MPLVTARALVLQAFPYSESSKILRLLTEAYGVRSVIAKGAQRPKSRFGGVLELFTEGDARFYLREGRDLHTLGGFDLVRSRQNLGRNLTAFAGASLLCELVLRFGTEEPAQSLFAAVSSAMDRLSSAHPGLLESRVLESAWSLITILGYRPELDFCVSCGTSIQPGAPARFDVDAGGVACSRCRPRGRTFDSTSRGELITALSGTGIHHPFSDPRLQRALLKAFLDVHLAPERPLRSLDLLLRQLP